MINLFRLQTQGLYPKVHIDMEVSSGEDNVPKTDASADKTKAPDGNDAKDGGASSAEPIAPNLIRSNAPKQANSSIADQVASIVPPISGCGRKRPATAIRQNQPLPLADHVMSQIELSLYHEPCSPLDLVVIDIIFGRQFKAF
jgi:hypothetical protein